MNVRLFVVVLLTLLLVPGAVARAACEFNGRDTVYAGLYSDQWESARDLTAFQEAGGGPLTFGGTFHHLGEGRENTFWILDQVWQSGAVPVANLEVPGSAAEMAGGEHDAALVSWAESVQRWLDADQRHALILAPMQEMNGDWVTWGMDPANFREAFRRIVETFRAVGMDETQVRWMFAPNAISVFPYSATDYWPGDDVVDIVGISAYNFGGEFGTWESVADVLVAETEQLRAFAREKPFMISQVGSSQVAGDQNGWLADMFEFVASHPNQIGFVYFNFDKETNWRVWDGDRVAAGWVEAVGDPRVQAGHPLDEWFRPGRIPFSSSPGTAYPLPTALCNAGVIDDPPVFSDVPPGLFYSAPVDWIGRAGLIEGYGDGTFRPERSVTRAEAVTLLWRVGCSPIDVPRSEFPDVTADWYRAAVDWAVATETVRGYPDGTFRPDVPVTRAEVATMLWRMRSCGHGAPTTFDDVPVRSWYADAVEWMVEERMARGTSPTTFAPHGPVTRGELVTLLFRLPG